VYADLIWFEANKPAQLMLFQDCHQPGTCLHHLPGLVGMGQALSDLILNQFTQGHAAIATFTVFNRLAL
jgi:hypothetical protein